MITAFRGKRGTDVPFTVFNVTASNTDRNGDILICQLFKLVHYFCHLHLVSRIFPSEARPWCGTCLQKLAQGITPFGEIEITKLKLKMSLGNRARSKVMLPLLVESLGHELTEEENRL